MLPLRAGAGAFLGGADLGACFFAETLFGSTLFPADFAVLFGAAAFADFAAVLFGGATLLVAAFAEAPAFLTSFLTAEAARRATGFLVEALLPAVAVRFADLGNAAGFLVADAFGDLGRAFETGFLPEAFFFDFNCLAGAGAAFLVTDA